MSYCRLNKKEFDEFQEKVLLRYQTSLTTSHLSEKVLFRRVANSVLRDMKYDKKNGL